MTSPARREIPVVIETFVNEPNALSSSVWLYEIRRGIGLLIAEDFFGKGRSASTKRNL
jgi:hypothetical protein